MECSKQISLPGYLPSIAASWLHFYMDERHLNVSKSDKEEEVHSGWQ